MRLFMTGLREKKKEQTREAILTAAHDLFVGQGFAVTTMEEVAKQAEVGVGTLYNYFASKNALLLSLAAALTEDLLERGRAVLAQPPQDPLEAVTAMFEVYASFPIHFPKPLLREIFASFFSEQELGEGIMRLDYLFVDLLAELVATLQARGSIVDAAEPQAVAMTLYSTTAIPMFMYAAMDDMDANGLMEMARQQLEIVFQGVRPR
jgi:AcrR family transcriptional regulator